MRTSGMVAAGLLCGLLLAGTGWTASAGPELPTPRVNLNTATASELARLPGIGPSKAKAIVEHRAHEPFGRPEDLRKVKGIGGKLYERLKDQITVGEPSAASPKGRGS